MAPAAISKNATPGRRKRTDNQYFDVGKVGRKTGITLQDTGIRDEHGLEPVSGIFSSPDQNGDGTLSSEGMDMQDSSALDVSMALSRRKTPHLPLPRQSTPKHTNIGSPKRMSSVKPTRHAADDVEEDSPRAHTQPPANRRLDFGATNRNRKSISVLDTQSPFVPKKNLRRSTGPARPNVFELPADDDEEAARTTIEQTNGNIGEDDDVEQSIEQDDGPVMLDYEDTYTGAPDETATGLEEPQEEEPAPAAASPKRKRGRPRKSDQSLNDSQAGSGSSSKKRDRTSLEDSGVSIAQGTMGPPPKRKRGSNANSVTIHRDEDTETVEQSAIAHGDEYTVDAESGAPLDAEIAAQLDSQLEIAEAEPAKKKGRPPKKTRGKPAAPKERDANRAMGKPGSPVKLNDSPSKRHRGGSVGPVSNVNLRATTPFEDANQHTSRFGRNLIQPLKYWENESLIWRGGEIEGIVRAEPVENPKVKKGKKRRRGRRQGRLDDIEEESETESTMPDEWEETQGVVTGEVASWNKTTQAGDSDEPEQKDLAFSAASIVTRDVAGAEFKYAKIMTMPFFGAGIVELPPEGYKRAKNSRRMQMVFFVHEGKVMVEVGAMGMEVNKFALSKGGVWVVPRGNNYAITNESRTKTVKIFFAQGCEVTGAE